MFETIVALATPPMKSALAIVRVSGDDCFDVVSKCFSKDIREIKENSIAAIVGQQEVSISEIQSAADEKCESILSAIESTRANAVQSVEDAMSDLESEHSLTISLFKVLKSD